MAIVNVTAGDEADFRAKAAAAVEGDVVNAPPGTYALTAAATVTAGCKIQGSGAAGATAGPTLVTVNGARNAITIDNSAATITGLEIRDIKFTGSGGALSAIGFVGSAGKKLHRAALRRLTISGFEDAVSLVGADIAAGAIVLATLEEIEAVSNGGYGINLSNATVSEIRRCYANNNGKNGIRALTCPVLTLLGNAAEANNQDGSASQEGGAQVLVKLSHAFSILGLDIEAMPITAGYARVGLCISNCNGGFAGGVQVAQSALQADSYAIRQVNSARGVRIGSLAHSFIQFPISDDGTGVYPSVSLRDVIQQA